MRGHFEILKNDYNKQQQIDVSIPEEYEEEVYIRVQIVSASNVKHSDLKYSIYQLKTQQQYSTPNYFTWHQQLENAQNSIYAKELFNQVRFEFEATKNDAPIFGERNICFNANSNSSDSPRSVRSTNSITATYYRKFNKILASEQLRIDY